MKTTAKLVTLFLLVLTSSLKAQEEYISQEARIQQAFEQIANAKGIEHSVNKYIERDEKAFDKVLEETEIHNFRIGRANFKLLDKLQEVFTSLESNNRLLSIYTDFNPIEYSTRQKWNIKTNKDAIIIGARKCRSEMETLTWGLCLCSTMKRQGKRTRHGGSNCKTDRESFQEWLTQQAFPSIGRA